jgi:hypothetical protein
MPEQNPLAKYQLQKIGNRRNTEGMFTNVNGNAARDARRAARREQRPMTFAEMQADGVARPGPGLEMFTGPQAGVVDAGMVNAPQTFVPQSELPALTPTGVATGPIGTAPGTTLAAPGAGTSVTPYSALREAALANLQAQFGAQRQGLEETLARRGLSASTFGGGMLGDLAGQQSRAMASLEADLLSQETARRNQQNELLLRLAQIFGM